MLKRININTIPLCINKSNYPAFVIFFYYALISCLLRINHGDDVDVFAKATDDISWMDYYISRYNYWSPRLIIETCLIYSVNHIWLWKILNSLLFLAIFLCLKNLLNCNLKGSWLLALIMLNYPFRDMGTAGWIATSLNYSWPLGALIIAAYYYKIAFFRKLKLYEISILCLSVIFSSNHEQSSLLMFALTCFCIYIFIINKRRPGTTLLLPLALNILSMIFIFTAPGNINRLHQEIQTWFPGFADFSFFDKIYIGLVRIERILIVMPNNISLIFAITVGVCGFRCFKSSGLRIIGCIPVFLILAHLLLNRYDSTGFFRRHFYDPEIIYQITSYKLQSFFPLITLAAYFISSFIIIFRLPFKSNYRFPISFIVIGVICAGICSQAILCFSPTLYASESRTFIYLYFSLVSASAFIYSRMKIKSDIPIFFAGFFAILQIAGMIKLIFSHTFY